MLGCNLENADLRGTILTQVNPCDFSYSKLSNAVLQDVAVDGASFRNCILNGANMRCLEIGAALFGGAQYDAQTLWPDAFDPAEAGCIYIK